MAIDNPAAATQKGMALLAELGDPAQQRLILGADYDRILAKISPPKKPSVPATSQKRSGTQPVGGKAAKKAQMS
jgi:hypothetical protein